MHGTCACGSCWQEHGLLHGKPIPDRGTEPSSFGFISVQGVWLLGLGTRGKFLVLTAGLIAWQRQERWQWGSSQLLQSPPLPAGGAVGNGTGVNVDRGQCYDFAEVLFRF